MSLTGRFTPPLTLEQLVELFRRRVDDLPGDVVDDEAWQNDDDGLLWKNDEIAAYADAAQDEYFRRAGGKTDRDTAEICQITVTAGTATYPYDQRILSIDRVKFVDSASAEHILTKRTYRWLDEERLRWESENGQVEVYVEDPDERSLTLYRNPELDGTLYLVVKRLGLQRLEWTHRTRELEVPREHQLGLVDYMLYLAYMKRDAETENPELSAAHLAVFTQNYGERPSARLERVRRQERRTFRRVRAHYI